MTKEITVDVEESLGYQTNGRLKKDKKEKANYTVKKFICPKCFNGKEISKLEFGEILKCEKCGATMVQEM